MIPLDAHATAAGLLGRVLRILRLLGSRVPVARSPCRALIPVLPVTPTSKTCGWRCPGAGEASPSTTLGRRFMPFGGTLACLRSESGLGTR
jgi:hypothetical protein